MKKLSSIILTLCFCWMLLHASTTLQASSQSLILWFEKLVPSMFMSIVCIKILYMTNSLQWITFPFCQRLFHISKQGMQLILCALLLGFPAGTCFIDEQIHNTNLLDKAKYRLLYVCMMPTSGFVIVTLGALFFQSLTIGFILYAIQVVTILTLLWFTRHHAVGELSSPTTVSLSFMQIFSTAIKETGVTLFMIGGYILCFNVLTQILLPYAPTIIQHIGSIFLEFSSGCAYVTQLSLSTINKLYCITSLLSFGGICIHMQIFSMIQHHVLSYRTFLYYRFLHMTIACSYLFLCDLLGFLS